MKYLFFPIIIAMFFLRTNSQPVVADFGSPAPESSGRVFRVFSPKYKCDKNCKCSKTNGEKVVLTNPLDSKNLDLKCEQQPKKGCGPTIVTKPNELGNMKSLEQLKQENGGRVTYRAIMGQVRNSALRVEKMNQATPNPDMVYVKEPEAFNKIRERTFYSLKELKPGECKDDKSDPSIVVVGGQAGQGDFQARDNINFVEDLGQKIGSPTDAAKTIYGIARSGTALGIVNAILDPVNNNFRSPEGWDIPITQPFDLVGVRGNPGGTILDSAKRVIKPGSYSKH